MRYIEGGTIDLSDNDREISTRDNGIVTQDRGIDVVLMEIQLITVENLSTIVFAISSNSTEAERRISLGRRPLSIWPCSEETAGCIEFAMHASVRFEARYSIKLRGAAVVHNNGKTIARTNFANGDVYLERADTIDIDHGWRFHSFWPYA